MDGDIGIFKVEDGTVSQGTHADQMETTIFVVPERCRFDKMRPAATAEKKRGYRETQTREEPGGKEAGQDASPALNEETPDAERFQRRNDTERIVAFEGNDVGEVADMRPKVVGNFGRCEHDAARSFSGEKSGFARNDAAARYRHATRLLARRA